MKKKYLNDKIKKVPIHEKRKYCFNFSKNLDSLFEALGHDHRDYKKLSKGEFFIEESINYDYEGIGEEHNETLICEKVSNKERNTFLLSDNDDVEKLYKKLKKLGK